MMGFFGTRFDNEVRDLIDEINPCGVILFARNIEDPEQTAFLNRASAGACPQSLVRPVRRRGSGRRQSSAPERTLFRVSLRVGHGFV